VRKLNRVVELLALAAVVFVGRPDTALAQTPAFSSNPLQISLTGPGGGNSATVTISESGVSAWTILSTPTNGGGNWLCGSISGSTLTVNVGSLCGNATQLQANTNYNGNVNVQDPAGHTGNLQVLLSVGNTSGGSNGLAATPNPVPFNVPSGSSSTSTSVAITFNGAPIGVSSLSTTTNTGLNWLQVQNQGSSVLVTVTPTSLTFGSGSDTGTVNVATVNGSFSFTVTLTVGSGGTSGLVANPNPLTLTASIGSTSTQGTVNITNNGSPIALSNVSVTSGQSFLSAFISNTGAVTVTGNPTGLSGNYFGSVNVTTSLGTTISFQVNFNVGTGGSSGLVANPNPLTITVPLGSASTQQTVNITNNGSPITLSNVSVTSGQSWLSAFISNTGVVTVTANPTGLSGNYFGAVNVSTTLGTSISFQVNFNVGTGGTSGLVANPNPLTINVGFGAASVTQNVNITFNGSQATIIGVSTNNQSWLQAFSQGNGSVSVTVNPSGLSGSYFGTVTAQTTNGPVTFNVNFTVGAGNSSGLVATPSVINFNIPLVGSGAQPQTVNVTFNGALATINSISTNVNGTWLLASTTNTGVVTVSCNCASLTMGSYSGTVTVNTTSGPINFQVNASVGQGGTSSGLTVNPSPLSLNLPVGTGATTQNVSVTFNGNPITVNSVSTTTTTGQTWLQANTTGITGGVAVTVNPTILQAGSYSGTVAINTVSGQVNLVVNLTVGSGGTTGLSVNPSVVTLTGATGGTTTAQNVSVTLNGNPVTINSVSSSTTTGQNWLLPSFSPSVAGTVTVSTNLTSLAAGAYSGTVTVNTLQGTVSFQVNLSVGGGVAGNGLVATPNPITFTESTAGTASPQIVSVTLNGAAQTIQTTTFAPTQLGLTFINTVLNPDGTATLTVNNVVSTQGTYTGSLTIYLTSGSSITVPVTLTFGTGGTGGLIAAPNPVNFNISSQGAPSSQNVSITFNGAAATITSVNTNTSTGQNWLQAVTGAALGTITVTANPFGLGAATYIGTVSVNTTVGTLSFQVNLTVGGGAPSNITLSTTALSFAYQTGQAQPPSQSVTLSASGGAQIAFTAAATTTTSPTWLSITPTSGTVGAGIAPASITANINATGLAAGTYSGTITITQPGANPLTITVTLTVTAAPVAPTPTVVAIQNAASSIPVSLSPGLNILIYGTNLGPSTLTKFVVGANGALSTTVAGTQVMFDTFPAAIIYTSSTLVSVMVPYEIAGRASTALVVTYNGASSTALQLRVVDTAPGIYTLSNTGSGQGAIFNQNGTVNGSGNPEVAGNYIQIYGTGEGQTSPAGVDGAILPNRLPLPVPVAVVAVTIGGVPVPPTDINYAGEAPSLVSGVFQVNAKIPAGVGPGAVSVVIRFGGVASQANVTVAVR
jgi:uncharacterized protein (TIGR03437 family)